MNARAGIYYERSYKSRLVTTLTSKRYEIQRLGKFQSGGYRIVIHMPTDSPFITHRVTAAVCERLMNGKGPTFPQPLEMLWELMRLYDWRIITSRPPLSLVFLSCLVADNS